MPRRAPAYVGSLIPQLQRDFPSAGAALAHLKSQGLGMRRQNFLRLWGAVKADEGLRQRLGARDIYSVRGPEEITQVVRPRARGFQFNVDVLVRDSVSGSFYFTPTAIVTPTMITDAEALDRAAQLLLRMQEGSERGTPAGEIRMGGEVTGVLERVAEEEEPIL